MAASDSVDPAAYRRRSFLYRTLAAAGARFGEIGGAAVAVDFGDPAREVEVARRMALADLSLLAHTGFKGAGTADWLVAQGVAVPPEPNWAANLDGGGLAVRQAEAEVMILGDLSGEGGWPARLKAAWWAEPVPPATPRGFPMPRDETHAWLLITGAHAPAMFAKICAVDLRARHFPVGRVAQTSIARTNGVVVREDRGDTPAYHLLSDCASAEYMWRCLLDAMAEFDGAPVGLDAVRALA